MENCEECNGKGVVGVESGLKPPALEFLIAFKCEKCSGSGVCE
jgi:DnaJ-class molecular chaperone